MGTTIKQVSPESSADVSSYCRYFFRGEQSTGDMENEAAGGALAIKNAGFLDAALWANPGYATVGGTLGNYCTLGAAQHDFSLAAHTMVFSLRIKKLLPAYPAAEQYIISSYAPGTNTGGIIVSCRPDGMARMYVNAADGTAVNLSSAAGVLTNSTVANEVSLVWLFPREAGISAQLGVNGLQANTTSAATIIGKSFVGGRDMRIGQPQIAAAIDAYQIAAFAAYAVPANLASINLLQVYDWAQRNPGTPMPDWVFA